MSNDTVASSDRLASEKGITAALLHNAEAGEGEYESHELLSILKSHGITASIHPPTGEGLDKALRAAPDMLIIAGGDGTVGALVTALGGSAPPIALLPTGTANNVGRWLGTWASPSALAEGWRGGVERSLGRGRAEGSCGDHRFLESIGVGAFVTAVEEADEQGLSGIHAGRFAFRTALAAAPALTVKLTLDGVPQQLETLMVEVMNIGLCGPNLLLATELANDDKLVLVTLPPERREEMVQWLKDPRKGKAPVDRIAAKVITIEWPGDRLRIDDMPVELTPPATVTLRREGGVRFLLPQHEGHRLEEQAI